MSLCNQMGDGCRKEGRAKAKQRGESSRAGGDACRLCPKEHSPQEHEDELLLEKTKGGSCNLTAALSHSFIELRCSCVRLAWSRWQMSTRCCHFCTKSSLSAPPMLSRSPGLAAAMCCSNSLPLSRDGAPGGGAIWTHRRRQPLLPETCQLRVGEANPILWRHE